MKVGPKSSLRPFLHRALQILKKKIPITSSFIIVSCP